MTDSALGQRTDVERLERRLGTRLGQAIADFGLPLVYVWEAEILEYVPARGFPVICCACPGCKDPTLRRHRVKKLLGELERVHPGIKRSLLGALSRVDLGSLPIPARPGKRAGDLLPVLQAATLGGLPKGG